VLFITVNKVNSKYIKELGQSSRKNSHFQEVSSVLEITFQIPALFKEFKGLHEPCKLEPTIELGAVYVFEV